jgi:hypothetical protein
MGLRQYSSWKMPVYREPGDCCFEGKHLAPQIVALPASSLTYTQICNNDVERAIRSVVGEWKLFQS